MSCKCLLYVNDDTGECDNEVSGIYNVYADSLRMSEWIQQDSVCSGNDISDRCDDLNRWV